MVIIDLKKKGIPWQGDISNLPEIHNIDPRRAIDRGGVWYIWISLFERIVLERGEVVHKGAYGSLTKCVRRKEVWQPGVGIWNTKSSKNAYLKESSKQVSFKEEAVLQHIAGDCLADAGFPNAAPPVLDIFISPNGLIVFTMECCDDSNILSTSLAEGSVGEQQLVGILFQIAFFLQVLEAKLGLNHRDIKTSNILIKDLETSRCIFDYGGFRWQLLKNIDVVLVDFGFSCLGMAMGRPSLIKSGIYYNPRDPCPKLGRDLYLFCSLLLKDLYTVGIDVSSIGITKVIEFLEKRLALEKIDVPAFLKKYNDKEPDWLYFLTGDSSLVFPHCEPSIILQSLAAAFPEYLMLLV
jgi:serine/threonine protein kinase